MVKGVHGCLSTGPQASQTHWETARELLCRNRRLLELSSVCIVDATGEIVKEAKVESHPDALVRFFKAFGLPLTVIGLEAGPLSQLLYAGLTEAAFVTSLAAQSRAQDCPPRRSLRRFMTTPSVGAIVAITYKSGLDDPGRIKKSRNA